MKQSLSGSFAQWMFLLAFITVFVFVNLGFLHFFTFGLGLWNLAYIVLSEYMALGLAYQVVELGSVLVMRKHCQPRHIGRLPSYPPVALVCCTCDDVDIGVLGHLPSQTYPNLHVFLLDDSSSRACQTLVDSMGLPVVRRQNRAGYKAGNLNNWLVRYGQHYPYLVVADADSILPDTFVEEMVSYAEHPANSSVAIFQSCIRAWNTANKFARLQDTMMPLYHRLKSRVDNRLGTNLSAGHNGLYRVEAIQNVGGFTENYLAEDFATSAEILKGGNWSSKTVPVVSYERMPENLSEYSRRQSRWAFQTFQLLSLNVCGLSTNMKLKLLMTVHHHAAPVAALIGMALLVSFSSTWGVFSADFNLVGLEDLNLLLRSNLFLLWIMLFLGPLAVRGCVSVIEGSTIVDYLESVLFHHALFVATIWPVMRRLAGLFTADRIGFNVTSRSPNPSMLQIIRLGWLGFGLVWICLLVVLLHPLANALNMLWILPGAVAPLIIYSVQRSNA